MIEGKKLIKDEDLIPLSENLVHEYSETKTESKLKNLIEKFLKRNEK